MRQIDFNVSNKFVKREVLIKALNLLSKEYLNMYITSFEDGILNYLLYRTAKSFYFLKKIGYYYIRNLHSISIKGFKPETLKFVFIHLKIVFEFSKNSIFEKNMFNVLFRRLVIRNLKRIKIIKNDSEFLLNAINSFLQNDFVSNKNKKILILLKYRVMKAI